MAQLISTYPIIRPTVMILKYILRQRDLNEAYKGGIGSFVVFNMVYAYILFLIRIKKINFISKSLLNIDENEEFEKLNYSKFFSSRDIKNIEDLGTFFYGLLNFYGLEFDYRNYGISNLGIGSFFNKNNSRFFYLSDKLCIANILDPSQDISRTAFNYDKIVIMFQELVFKIFNFDKFLFGCLDKYENKLSLINYKNNDNDKDIENFELTDISKENKVLLDENDCDNISYFDKLIFYKMDIKCV